MCWFVGVLKCKCVDVVCWCVEALVVQVLVFWCSGILVCWRVSVLRCWCVELLEL